MRPTRDDQRLRELARAVGDDWRSGPYYDEAEAAMDYQWRAEIWPLISAADFACTVELAPGHGRNSERLRQLATRLYLVDINIENIDFLKRRFADVENVVVVHNNGVDLAAIPDATVTFVYSFDSMVHFDSDVVRAYLGEFERVLKAGGQGFCHYSNYTGNPTGSYRDHPGWRNFMSVALFEHYLTKEGLTPIRSRRIRETADSSDAVTLFRK
jgi:ubiquinone/menaquinone biosynthesis C-methylase UbiE